MKQIIKSLSLVVIIGLLSNNLSNAQTNFEFPTQVYDPAINPVWGCDNYFTFKTHIDLVGIKVQQIYNDNGTNDGSSSFRFEVVFNLKNTFTGVHPSGSFYQYEYVFTSNNPLIPYSPTNNVNMPIGSGEYTLTTSNSITYHGSASLLGLVPGVTYTDPAIMSQFGFSVASIVYQMPCKPNSTTVSAPVMVNPTNPVPVVMSDLKLQQNNENVELHWYSFDEQNFKGFEVESSTDAKNWTNKGFVASLANEKGNAQLSYKFTDINVNQGKMYYRLKAISNDNTFQYSNVEVITIKSAAIQIKVFPNPARETFSVEGLSSGSVALIDPLGRIIMEARIVTKNQKIALNNIPSGTYILKIITENGAVHHPKLAVQK